MKNSIFIALTLVCCTLAHSMEPPAITDNTAHIEWLTMPKDVWLHIIAYCNAKNAMRKTCAYWYKLASSNNVELLTHPALVLNAKALEQLLLYHGELGDTEIVRNLLSKGADPNACDNKGKTLMHYAAHYGHAAIAEILLQHPALITTDIDKDDNSPFKLAIQHHQGKVVKQIFLACNLHGGDALYYAISKCSIQSVRALLACDVDANSSNQQKEHYPLVEAAINGHTNIMKFLIANGADIHYRSPNQLNINATPLHFAASWGHPETTQLLIDYGIDINAKGIDENCTPLHCASWNGHSQVIKILLNNGAQINEKDKDGKTALDYAEKYEIKKLLIEHGAKRGTGSKREKDNCIVQ